MRIASAEELNATSLLFSHRCTSVIERDALTGCAASRAGCAALPELLEAAWLQLLEAAAGGATLLELLGATEEKKLRSEVAGCSALLPQSELIIAGCAALPEARPDGSESNAFFLDAGCAALLEVSCDFFIQR